MSNSVYRVTEVIGTSPDSWEAAARNAVETASRSVRAAPSPSDPAAPPARDSAPRPGAAFAAPPLAHPDPTTADRAQPARLSAQPPLNELRFTLPRAVVERLEQLERRLEKLETFSTPTSRPRATSDRQVGSERTP